MTGSRFATADVGLLQKPVRGVGRELQGGSEDTASANTYNPISAPQLSSRSVYVSSPLISGQAPASGCPSNPQFPAVCRAGQFTPFTPHPFPSAPAGSIPRPPPLKAPVSGHCPLGFLPTPTSHPKQLHRGSRRAPPGFLKRFLGGITKAPWTLWTRGGRPALLRQAPGQCPQGGFAWGGQHFIVMDGDLPVWR